MMTLFVTEEAVRRHNRHTAHTCMYSTNSNTIIAKRENEKGKAFHQNTTLTGPRNRYLPGAIHHRMRHKQCYNI